MAELKSVSFSPILEQNPDDVSMASSNTGSLPEGMNFEDAYIASLSKSAKKYHLPSEDERRVPRRRRIVLLAFGFVLLLAIGGVVIYFVTRELYNKEQQYYSGAVSEDKMEIESSGTHIRNGTISMGSYNTILPSFVHESSEKPVSLYSSKTTAIQLSSVSKLLTSITVFESSGLVTRFGSKKHNATTTAFVTSNVAHSSKAMWHSSANENSTWFYSSLEPIRNSFKTSEIQMRTSYSIVHGTSSWNDDLSKRRSFTASTNKTTNIYLSPLSSLGIIKSTQYIINSAANSSEVQKAILYTLSTSEHKTKVAGNFSVQTAAVTVQDAGVSVNGLATSDANYSLSTISAIIGRSSEMAYSSSVGENADIQVTTKTSEKLDRTSSYAATTVNPPSSVRNSVQFVSEEMNIRTGTPLPTAKSVVPSSMPYDHSVSTNANSSFEGRLSGAPPSQEWRISQSTKPVQTSTIVELTSLEKESSFHYRSPWSVQFSFTPVTSHIYGSVTSFRNDQFRTSTPALATLSSHTASMMNSRKLPLKHSGSLSKEFSSVQVTPSPSSFILTKYGSSEVQEILTQTKSRTLAVTRPVIDHTAVALRTAKLVISTLPLHSSQNSDGYSTVGAGKGVKSLESITSLARDPQTGASIGQSQSSIKAISFSSTVLYSNTRLPSLTSSSGEFNSPSIALGPSKASVLYGNSVGNLSTVASEKTSTNNVSLRISKRASVRYSSSSTSKQILTSSTQESMTVSSSVQVQQLNSKSTSGNLTTFSTVPNKKLSTTHYHTMIYSKSTGLIMSTITRFPFTTVLPTTQSTLLLEGVLSDTRSVLTEKTTPEVTASYFEHGGISIITSRHQSMYTTTSDTPRSSTVRLLPIITVSSRGPLNTVSASGTASSQVDHVWLSSANFSAVHVRTSSKESINISPSRKRVQSVSITQPHKTFQHTLLRNSSGTPTNATFTIATMSSSIQSVVSSQNKSSASLITPSASGNISFNLYNATYTLYASINETAMSYPSPTYTSMTQVKPTKTSDSYLFSLVPTTLRPTLNTTTQFKIMDGSLIMRNRDFHANLSNQNSTMFKDLAGEVEEIITDIVSVDAEVTSFRKGSIIVDFFLKVPYDSPSSDQDYAKMLSEANETLWRGYHVTNITVTLRVSIGRLAPRSQDGGGLSEAAIVAIFVVFSLLLVAAGGVGVYVCKKKGVFKRSRVKPSDSPIPPSELEKIQPVRRGTWVMNEEPFLKVDVPKDPNYRSASFYETLSMRVLDRNDTETGEGCDPDALRKSARSPFKPEYTSSEGSRESVTKYAALASRSSTKSMNDDVDRPFSGSSANTYLNIGTNSTHSEDEC